MHRVFSLESPMVNAMNPLTAAMFLPPAGMQPSGASGESKDSIVSSHSSMGGKPVKDKVRYAIFNLFMYFSYVLCNWFLKVERILLRMIYCVASSSLLHFQLKIEIAVSSLKNSWNVSYDPAGSTEDLDADGPVTRREWRRGRWSNGGVIISDASCTRESGDRASGDDVIHERKHQQHQFNEILHVQVQLHQRKVGAAWILLHYFTSKHVFVFTRDIF